MFDIRKSNQSLCIMSGAHSNVIHCLDWSKKHPLIVASGSIDNDIKIWSVSTNHRDIEERLRIKHVSGISDLKWHKMNKDLLSVTSLNRDSSVTIFDINHPYRPRTIIKGYLEYTIL